MAENRQAFSVRLPAADKEILTVHTEACGLDTSVGARQVLTLCTAFLQRGDGLRWPELVHRIERALRDDPPVDRGPDVG